MDKVASEHSVETHVARRAAPWAILACVLWGSAFAAVKIGLEYMPPLTFAGIRFLLAGCLLIPLCRRSGGALTAVWTHRRLVLTVSSLQTIVLYGTFFFGMQLVQGAQGAIILGSSPLVTAVLAHVLMKDDRMTLSKTATIALGMVGIMILAVAAKPWQSAGLGELAGMGLLAAGVVAGQLANITVARSKGAMNPLTLNSAQMILGGAVLFVLSIFVHGLPRSPPPAQFFAVLFWLAAISAVAFSIWFTLLHRVKVSRLNMWKFLIPVVGVLLSWLLLPDESPRPETVAGMVCVATAVLLSNWMDVRKARKSASI